MCIANVLIIYLICFHQKRERQPIKVLKRCYAHNTALKQTKRAVGEL